MQFFKLTPLFFSTFPYHVFPEFERKSDRPYNVLIVKYNGFDVAIPIRHHVPHAYKVPTINNSGLDFTKAVLITDPNFVDFSKPVLIDHVEYSILYSQKGTIQNRFLQYVNTYIKAFNFLCSSQDITHPRYKSSYNTVSMSTLQYFHPQLGLQDIDLKTIKKPSM